MKKTFKKATAVILTLVMMLTAAPLSGFVGIEIQWLSDLFSIKASAETTAYSGTCGDNLTWTLDTETGLLEIIGTGTMYNWTKYDERPEWFNYRAYVESISIEVGVVSVGHYAFRLFNNLKNVLIPDSVTCIGIGAFYECGSLEKLTIPNGVVSVEPYAIAYCYRLSEVIIGKNVKEIGEFALFDCENLSKINVNSANNYYSSDSFGVLFNKDKTELIKYPNGNTRTSYAIPNTVIQINDHAFLSSSNLITITIPDSVEFLGYRAFDSCESVLDIVIPDSVTEIEDSAFRLCDNLKNVTLSNSLEYIADSVFFGCVSLKSIEIPNSVLDIKDGAFSGCSSLETVEIPDNVKSIGMAAFRNCTTLRNIILPIDIERIGSDAFAFTAFYNDKNNWDGSALYIGNYLINVDKDITGELVIKNGTVMIADVAIGACENLSSVKIPESVINIGAGAFSGCANLSEVNIPKEITVIKDGVFKGCYNSLVKIVIPEGVTCIEGGAFAYCYSLEEITIPKTLKIIETDAFYWSDKISDVNFNGTETEWNQIIIKNGNDCLINATIHFASSETNVYTGTCGDNLTWTLDTKTGLLEISGNGEILSFSEDNSYPWDKHRDKIKTIILNNGITKIGESAFSECKELMSLTIPSSVTDIGYSAFYDCESLDSIVIPDSVKSIGDYAFSHCIALDSITFPDVVISMSNTSFYETGYYNDINNWIDGVLYIGKHLVAVNSDIPASYKIKDGTKAIAYNAFYGCEEIEEIEIPESVEVIFSGAFSDCLSLKTVKMHEGIISIDSGAFSFCESLTDITIPDSVKYIAPYAFSWTGYYINEKNWVDNVLYIGNHLIVAREILSGEYAIKDGTKSIAEEAFYSCFELTSVKIPKSTIVIGENAFGDCENLTDIYYNGNRDEWDKIEISEYNEQLLNARIHFNDVNSGNVGDNATWEFDKNTGVLEISGTGALSTSVCPWEKCKNDICIIKVNEGITAIENYTFSQIPNLTKVILPTTLTSIWSFVFNKCSNLAEIYIPKNVTWIGMMSFADCDNLKNVYYSGTQEDWSKITIEEMGGGNACLTNATIYFNFFPDHTHSYTSTVTKDATCTETGIRTYTCECEDTYTEEIAKLSHSFTHKTIVSTCKQQGYEYDYCSSCKGTYNKVDLPLAKHSTKHMTVESTCKVQGIEYDLCTVCGDTSNTVVLPLLSHNWTEWELTTAPTETSQGIETRICASCGETETRKIGKLNIVKDENTGIEIEYTDEYDTGIEVDVEEVYDGDSYQLIEENYGKIKTTIFDINTLKDGIKVQPSGKVKVRIPIPEEFSADNNIFVCFVDSINGTVENIPVTVIDEYIEFEAEHFSYYAVVQHIGKVNKVTVNDFTVKYKDAYKISPKVEIDENVDYTVTYTSSNPEVVMVDKNGNITTKDRGTATITCTVTDEFGNEVKDTCQVEVKLKWWQWIIWIFLWGWLWY